MARGIMETDGAKARVKHIPDSKKTTMPLWESLRACIWRILGREKKESVGSGYRTGGTTCRSVKPASGTIRQDTEYLVLSVSITSGQSICLTFRRCPTKNSTDGSNGLSQKEAML